VVIDWQASLTTAILGIGNVFVDVKGQAMIWFKIESNLKLNNNIKN